MLSQTKVVDYVVRWLKESGWNVIYAHYPEGHHISPEYGKLKIIQRKFIDVIAKKGECLFLIQCNRKFKYSYFEKLKKIRKTGIKDVDFEILLRGVAFSVPPQIEERVNVVQEGCLLLEVREEGSVRLYGSIPTECKDE